MSLERAEHKVNALHPRCGCDLFSLCPAEPACCLPAAKTGSDACDGFSFICPIRGGIFLSLSTARPSGGSTALPSQASSSILSRRSGPQQNVHEGSSEPGTTISCGGCAHLSGAISCWFPSSRGRTQRLRPFRAEQHRARTSPKPWGPRNPAAARMLPRLQGVSCPQC